MKELRCIDLSRLISSGDKVFLCFEPSADNEDALMIKARFGNRKFLTTRRGTDDAGSVCLLRWKNEAGDCIYESIRPEVKTEKGLIRIDIEKEFALRGISLNEGQELDSDLDFRKRHIWGERINTGEKGFYFLEGSWADSSRDELKVFFSKPGLKFFGSRVRRIWIDTFESLSGERTKPFYEYLNSAIDGGSEASDITDEKLEKLLREHLPESMYIELLCEDRLLRAGIDHLGEVRRWYMKQSIEEGVKESGVKTASEDPLGGLIREAG